MTGILLVDKEQDWTSSDVVAKLRGVLHERRIGHAGTLDPLATGLLIVMVGRAARASDYLMRHTKKYRAHLRCGIVTDTQDITGRVLSETALSVSSQQLEEVLQRFRGEQEQIPPMYSAIKIGGKKLYSIARGGGEVERPPRPITVSSLTLAGTAGEDFILDIECSAGTYVRTLCHDIGQALGCGACMAALRRVSSGAYRVEHAHTVAEISSAASPFQRGRRRGFAAAVPFPFRMRGAEEPAFMRPPVNSSWWGRLKTVPFAPKKAFLRYNNGDNRTGAGHGLLRRGACGPCCPAE